MAIDSLSKNSQKGNEHSRWIPLLTGLFVTALLVSNIIAVKLISVGPIVVPVAVILFPLSYILADVLTEVYGYATARRVIWIGFACNLLAVIAIIVAGRIPGAAFWQNQNAYDTILGFSYRLLIASFFAYLAGEFLNAFVLAKLKLMTAGRYLWLRTIGSTLLGQALDSGIFILVAFWGILPVNLLFTALISQWLVKVLYEAAATPVTYLVVRFLKRTESIDHYDHDTKFNPVSFWRK